MKTTSLAAFHIIGITIRTTNKKGAAGTDIPNVWNTFMRNHIAAKIQNKIDNIIYCIYTDYEGDHIKNLRLMEI